MHVCLGCSLCRVSANPLLTAVPCAAPVCLQPAAPCLQVTFSLTSESTPWITRTYTSLSQAAQESSDSRLYAGVHFPSGNTDGLKLGRLVAAKVFDRIQPGGAIVTQQRKGASAGAVKLPTGAVSTEAAPRKAVTGRRLMRLLHVR
jgi:hypothetical protein